MKMTRRFPGSYVLKYYFYTATTSAGFIAPIYVVLMQERGLSLAEISVLSVIYSVLVVLGEGPTGYVGDRIGRKNTLLLSVSTMVVAMLAWGLASSFATFGISYALWALAMVLRSGTGSAWLYDSLKEHGKEEEYARVNGKARSLMFTTGAITAFVAGPLASVNIFYPFVASALLNALGLFVILTFPKNTEIEREDRFTVTQGFEVIRDHLLMSDIRRFVVYVVFFFAVIGSVGIFIQPTSLQVGLKVEHLGFMYAGFKGVSAFGSYFSGTVNDRIGIDVWIHSAPLILGLIFASILVFPILAIPAFFATRGVRRVTLPLRDQYLNNHTDSVGRATVLSAVSMLVSLSIIPIKLLAGVIADGFTPVTAIGILGIILFTVSFGVIGWKKPVKTKERNASHSKSCSTGTGSPAD